MSLYQTLFCFICTHLTSGEKDADAVKRNADVHEILRRTQFHSISSIGLPKSIPDHEWVNHIRFLDNLGLLSRPPLSLPLSIHSVINFNLVENGAGSQVLDYFDPTRIFGTLFPVIILQGQGVSKYFHEDNFLCLDILGYCLMVLYLH